MLFRSAAFAFTDSITVCNQNSYTFTTPYQPGFLYQWYLDGSPISNSDTNSITSTQTGTYYVQVVGVNFCTNTSDSVYIEFNPVPAATINALDSIYCDNDVADTLTASPAGGYFTIDGDTAFVFDPVSAGLGQHTVQYFYTDTNGCSTVLTQQVLVDACLGINELKNNSIQIIPNPNNGVFKLMLAAEFKTRINVMVTDVNGLKVFEKKNIRIENNAVTIDLRKLPESTYIISVTGNNTCISKRLIIKK